MGNGRQRRPGGASAQSVYGNGRPAGPAPGKRTRSDARYGGTQPRGPLKEHNAKMRVEALRADGRSIAIWENPAFFDATMPVSFETKGPPWKLQGTVAETLRVDSDATGTSGRDLVRWIHPYEKQGARILRVQVTALRGAGGTPPEAVDYRPQIEMEPIDLDVDAMERDFLEDIQGAPDGVVDGTSQEDRPGVVDGTDDEIGGSIGEGRGRALSDATDVSGGGVSSKGSSAGDADGSDSPSWTGGGRTNVEGGRIGDNEDGKSGGMRSGSPDGRGAVGADGGWLKQWIDTPDYLAPLFTAGIIIWEANPADLGKQWFMKALKGGAKHIGKAVKKAAKEFAARKVKQLANEVRHAPGLSPDDIKKKLALTETALEEEYVRATKQGIQHQLEDREATLTKLINDPHPDPAIQAHMRRNLEDLQELRREVLEDFPDLPARKTPRPHLEIPGASKELNGFLGENFSEVTHFGGMKVYKRGDIDLTIVDEKGLTNLERMKRGRPPLGDDGQPLEVHHLLMSNDGPVVELTNSLHKKHHKTVHINDNKTGSGISRPEFDGWRVSWWQHRAKELGGK